MGQKLTTVLLSWFSALNPKRLKRQGFGRIASLSADSRAWENLLPTHSGCQNSVLRGGRTEVLFTCWQSLLSASEAANIARLTAPSKSGTVVWMNCRRCILKLGIWFFTVLLRVHMVTLSSPFAMECNGSNVTVPGTKKLFYYSKHVHFIF